MASRAFKPASKRLYINAKVLAGKFAVGATGAVGTIQMKGVASVVRDNVGLYTITMTDKYADLAFAQVMTLHASATNGYWNIVSEDVDGTKKIVIANYDLDDDTAEEVPNGATVFVKFDLCDSSLGIA